MRQHAGFLALIGSASLVVGGIMISVGVAEANSPLSIAHTSTLPLSNNGWFMAGVIAAGLGVLMEIGAILAYVSGNDASLGGPTAQDDKSPIVDSSQSTSGRVLVDRAPSELMAFFKDHMTIQAKRLLAPYIGKWLKVTGKLRNVSDWNGHSCQVSFASGEAAGVLAYFQDRAAVEQLELMKRGTLITIVGQIERVESFMVELEKCELVS